MIRRAPLLISASSFLGVFFWSVSPMMAQTPSPVVQTITFTEEQLLRYVQAVRAIERRRAEILRQAKNSQGWALSVQLAEQTNRDVCAVPRQQQTQRIQALCEQLFEFSEQEIRRHGLTNREFNQITIAHRQNPQLKVRIQGLWKRISAP